MSDDSLLHRIRREYAALPGLRLTIVQAQRLWTLDRDACSSALSSLVESRFLVITRDGSYARADLNRVVRKPAKASLARRSPIKNAS
jgi:hypothetical protein